MTYQEFLDELIPVNLNNPMRREEYYKKYMHGNNPREAYDQLVRLEKQDERDRL